MTSEKNKLPGKTGELQPLTLKGSWNRGDFLIFGFVIAFIAVVIVVVAMGSWDSGPTERNPSNPAKTDSRAEQNSDDGTALEDTFGWNARIDCALGADDYLKDTLKYEYKWDGDPDTTSKFDKYSTKVKSPDVLTKASDRLLVQNGLGSFERASLTCDYDTRTKKVIHYNIEMGQH